MPSLIAGYPSLPMPLHELSLWTFAYCDYLAFAHGTCDMVNFRGSFLGPEWYM